MGTISNTFYNTVLQHGNRVALRDVVPKNGAPPDQVSYTWNQYHQAARDFAKALIAVGVEARRVVTIQGANSSKWLFANVGTILAGGVSAGVYPTNNDEMSKHVAKNSAAEVVIVEDEKQLKKYAGIESTALKCFVVWNKVQDQKIQDSVGKPVFTWDEFISQGESVPDEKLNKRIEEQKSEEVCSLIYTSGTTGLPKAAALTHENLTWTAATAGRKFSLHPDHRGLSYLPLSHIAAQQLDCIAPMIHGYSVDIAPADALKGNNLKQHIINTRPTYFLAVPRVWEKFKEGIEQKLEQAPWYKKLLFTVATTIGKWASHTHLQLSAKNPDMLSWMEFIAKNVSQVALSFFDQLIFTSVKTAMGLDRCEIAVNGAGFLDPQVVDFFAGLNIRIIDVFGMSESSGPATVADHPETPAGSAGRALEGTQIVIQEPDEQGEGEILIKGKHIFKEYWANPEATNEAFTASGFFRTGDKGKLDAQGNLFITGRLKELIKTSGGENIPPVRIEQKIQQELPLVSHAVVIGDKQKFLTCLLTLKTEQESDTLTKEALELLEKIGSPAKTLRDAAQDPAVRQYLKEGIERANKQADSQAQQVQKFEVLLEDFSVANGLMTPTLKLKRSEIAKRYAEQIAKMYAV